MTLMVHCNTESQAAFPSISTLQEYSGITNRNTLVKGIKLLEEHGIIKVIRSDGEFNKVNLYVFQAVNYWKPIPGWKEKLEKANNKSQYQVHRKRSIKKPEYRSDRRDTLTNLSENSPNKITSIGDILKRQMQGWQHPDKIAIQEPSGHSVVGTGRHESFPVITGKLREDRSNTSDTTTNEDSTDKKREKTVEWTQETNNMGHRVNDPNIKSAYE
jgi:hypothetical protein